MKILFTWLPIVGLMLGVLAIASDIMAKTSSSDISDTILVQHVLVSSCEHGYLALVK